ncbi:MAG: decaprenyl-phosphate phosphoribosyltransferase [Solirubrobacteraceae bacterium]|jgi:decaprenyl-phosphate phosphoribosyltransferase|nr:decaprenyl-phosphate phosphoribosyltransferase [Solirubrobacteraceae bacterium]
MKRYTLSSMGFPRSGAVDAATVPGLDAQSRRGPLHAALVTLRPKQWIKNVLVIAAAGAAGALGADDVPFRVGVAFVAFCMLASGIYAVNDVRDREEDRRHPRKRRRPIAAGELEPSSALVLGFALMLGGLVLCAAVRPLLLVVGLGYLALTLTYTMVWRRLPVLDIVAIAGGFVLRAVAGGVAAPVTLSRWFIVVVTFSALLVAAGKRLAELGRAEREDAVKRRVLHFYTAARLRLLITGSAACALFSYCVWAFGLPTVNGFPWRPLTILPFAACLARYGALVQRGDGEAPEEMLLHDRPLQLAGAAWLVVFVLGLRALS